MKRRCVEVIVEGVVAQAWVPADRDGIPFESCIEAARQLCAHNQLPWDDRTEIRIKAAENVPKRTP